MANQIYIRLSNGPGPYEPGAVLDCEYEIDVDHPGEITAVEASVLWYTEGKGDEDMSVHYFERSVAGDVVGGHLGHPRRLRAELPKSPFSYSGVIVKIRWCVRVRAFFRRGRSLVHDEPFVLGDAPAAREVDTGGAEPAQQNVA